MRFKINLLTLSKKMLRYNDNGQHMLMFVTVVLLYWMFSHAEVSEKTLYLKLNKPTRGTRHTRVKAEANKALKQLS